MERDSHTVCSFPYSGRVTKGGDGVRGLCFFLGLLAAFLDRISLPFHPSSCFPPPPPSPLVLPLPSRADPLLGSPQAGSSAGSGASPSLSASSRISTPPRSPRPRRPPNHPPRSRRARRPDRSRLLRPPSDHSYSQPSTYNVSGRRGCFSAPCLWRFYSMCPRASPGVSRCIRSWGPQPSLALAPNQVSSLQAPAPEHTSHTPTQPVLVPTPLTLLLRRPPPPWRRSITAPHPPRAERVPAGSVPDHQSYASPSL